MASRCAVCRRDSPERCSRGCPCRCHLPARASTTRGFRTLPLDMIPGFPTGYVPRDLGEQPGIEEVLIERYDRNDLVECTCQTQPGVPCQILVHRPHMEAP